MNRVIYESRKTGLQKEVTEDVWHNIQGNPHIAPHFKFVKLIRVRTPKTPEEIVKKKNQRKNENRN